MITAEGPGTGTTGVGQADFETIDNWSHFGGALAAEQRGDHLRRDFIDSVVGAPEVGERVIKVRLRGKYLDIGRERNTWTPEAMVEALVDEGVISTAEARRFATDVGGLGLDEAGFRTISLPEAQQFVTDLYAEHGYDGVKYTNLVEDRGSISFLVFDNANVKSQFAEFRGGEGLVGGSADLLAGGSALNRRQRDDPQFSR